MGGISEVKFRENSCFLEWGKGNVEQWKRVLVSDRDLFQTPVFYAHAQSAVLHKEEPSAKWRGRRNDQA